MMLSAVVGQECGWWDISIAGVLAYGGQSVTVDDVRCDLFRFLLRIFCFRKCQFLADQISGQHISVSSYTLVGPVHT